MIQTLYCDLMENTMKYLESALPIMTCIGLVAALVYSLLSILGKVIKDTDDESCL